MNEIGTSREQHEVERATGVCLTAQPDRITPALFGGFSPPLENWSRLPHDLIDALPLITSLAELKVVLYVLRHTWGFQEYGQPKHITLDEFQHGRMQADRRMDHGVGMRKSAIIDGIRRAIAHHFLLEFVDNSDKARIHKTYQLAMSENHTSDLMSENQTPEVRKSDTRGTKIRHRTQKDTLERNLEKDISANTAFAGSQATDPLAEDFEASLQKDVNYQNAKTQRAVQTLQQPAPSPAELSASQESESAPINSLQTYLNDLAHEPNHPPATFDSSTWPAGHWFSCAGDNAHVHYVLEGKQKPACKRVPFQYRQRRDFIPSHLTWCPGCVQAMEAAHVPKAKTARKRDAVFDSLTLLCYGTADISGMKSVGSSIGKAEKEVKQAEPTVTPERVTAFGAWWDDCDFRGQKGQKPEPHQIPGAWLKFMNGECQDAARATHASTGDERTAEQNRSAGMAGVHAPQNGAAAGSGQNHAYLNRVIRAKV